MYLEGQVVSQLGTCSLLVVIGSCGAEKLILNLGELCFLFFYDFILGVEKNVTELTFI